jgi:ABC-type uncharacterized transport system substrate-binding protein
VSKVTTKFRKNVDLAMQALTKFDLVINFKTAKALGVTTASSLRCTWSLLAPNGPTGPV